MPKEPSTPPSKTSTTASEDQAENTAAHQAQAMRARLGAQRDAEEILAEAAGRRQAAAEEADTIVAAAEALATQLVAEATEAAEKLTTEAQQAAEKATTEAQERADGILARAYFEAEDLQRHTEEERARIREEVTAAGLAEIESFRERSVGLLDRAEGGLRTALRSLEELRSDPADRADDDTRAVAELASAPDSAPEDAAVAKTAAAEAADRSTTPRHDDPEARPLGWLFRASQA
jgi:hypothetical protein